MTTAVRLRRSLLFVPGAEEQKIEKAAGAGADTLLLDLEDSVTPERKPVARQQVAAAIAAGSLGKAELVVRVNAAGTPYFEDDLAAVGEAGAAAIMLPKTEGAKEVVRATEAAGLPVLALVETARGILAAGELAQATGLVALCFGHVDLARDMGLTVDDASKGILFHARCQLVLAAKAAGLCAIDSVSLSLTDEAAFGAEARAGLELGYEGKLCVHPAQVAIANRVFTPTDEQIAYANRVVVEWKAAEAEGRGVFALDGRMFDRPLVLSQQRLLERARLAGVAEAGQD